MIKRDRPKAPRELLDPAAEVDHERKEAMKFYTASVKRKKAFDFKVYRQPYVKNAIEKINGNLFTHGGIHPDVANSKLNLEEINQLIRNNYHHSFSSRSAKTPEHIFTSAVTGPCWYRGYFREDLTQQQVQTVLDKFNASAVVVGHTIQSKVTKAFNGKVFGIDVKHPSDNRTDWPHGESEGLLIDGDTYYRVLATGIKSNL